MLSKILRAFFGTNSEREVKRLSPVLSTIRERESHCARMTDAELRMQTGILKAKVAAPIQAALDIPAGDGEEEEIHRHRVAAAVQQALDTILPDAFAVVAEASKRVVGMRPFDVQLVGGLVLHHGAIAEMVTGEGKTLVATLPSYLNALTGLGVHIITVSDYHAQRDREWMGPIHEFLGLTVGLIQHDMSVSERQVGYRSDITYGTNTEFGFDYLRDNMCVRPEIRVQRLLNYAIVDEIDSILIDEARTPLIISGRPEKSTDIYYRVDDIVCGMRKGVHYEVEEKGHHAMLSEEGMEYAERRLGVDNLYTDEHISVVHMIEQALRAHNFYKKDDEYIVNAQSEVLIVDEFTGRVLEGRRYSDGLHQAIEAKERVSIQFESQTIASVTYQNYFRLYSKLAGMTGTAVTEAAEFAQIYSLDVVQIPTNLPLLREDENDLVFATEDGKFRNVVNEICRLNEEGRPVLVGTVSVEKSEKVATMLRGNGVEVFEVLNAKQHGREASIVANAGKWGAITIATNMAGRGTDIKLGEGVRELGGLAIIGTERHESRRIDNQLRGRCGRQGDPGTTRFFLSLEDEVARLFGGDRVKKLLDFFGSEQMDDEPLSQRMVTRTIERSQRQVEEYNFEIRKHLKKYDDIMDRQRKIIYNIRRDVLEDRDISGRLKMMFENVVMDGMVEYAPEEKLPEEWDLDTLKTRLEYAFGITLDLEGDIDSAPKPLLDSIMDQIMAEYALREKSIEEELRQSLLEQTGNTGEGINLAKMARRRVHDYEKMALLRAVDDKWIDHLYSMDYLRESVRLRAYGQKDPLVEYKSEGFEMFQEMMASIEESTIQMLFRLTDPEVRKARVNKARAGQLTQQNDPFAQLSQYSYVGGDKMEDHSFATYDTGNFALGGKSGEGRPKSAPQEQETREAAPKRMPVRHATPKVNPNDPCPCGSGRKYKKCCGAVQ